MNKWRESLLKKTTILFSNKNKDDFLGKNKNNIFLIETDRNISKFLIPILG